MKSLSSGNRTRNPLYGRLRYLSGIGKLHLPFQISCFSQPGWNRCTGTVRIVPTTKTLLKYDAFVKEERCAKTGIATIASEHTSDTKNSCGVCSPCNGARLPADVHFPTSGHTLPNILYAKSESGSEASIKIWGECLNLFLGLDLPMYLRYIQCCTLVYQMGEWSSLLAPVWMKHAVLPSATSCRD